MLSRLTGLSLTSVHDLCLPFTDFRQCVEAGAEVWADTNFQAIKNKIGEYSRNIDVATLRKIADLIGYKEGE